MPSVTSTVRGRRRSPALDPVTAPVGDSDVDAERVVTRGSGSVSRRTDSVSGATSVARPGDEAALFGSAAPGGSAERVAL
jgi:hypothetical protein